MQKQIKNALILLLAFVAIIAALAVMTDSFDSLQRADPVLFSIAALLFIASIVVWLFSWSALIKGRATGLLQTTAIGFGCVFASLTPVQVGADALRSVKLKEHGKVRYSESISASMVVKGLKFLFIALIASISFMTMFLSPLLEPWVKAALFSGFAVVVLATALFLLPIHRGFGIKIASLLKSLSRVVKPAEKISAYFQSYSAYLQAVSRPKLLLVLLLAIISLALEFLAFLFCFFAAGIAISFFSALALFSILAILERTPFLPRGIGVVEAAGFIFLSTEAFASMRLGPAQIGTVIVLFDVARLVVPAVSSLAVYSLLPKLIK